MGTLHHNTEEFNPWANLLSFLFRVVGVFVQCRPEKANLILSEEEVHHSGVLKGSMNSWDILLDWLQMSGLTPEDVITAVEEYRDRITELTREQIRKSEKDT